MGNSLSAQLGIDPGVSLAVFTDQIEANKTVQYGLYSSWRLHLGQAPTTGPIWISSGRSWTTSPISYWPS